jgi:hypothetical protein
MDKTSATHEPSEITTNFKQEEPSSESQNKAAPVSSPSAISRKRGRPLGSRDKKKRIRKYYKKTDLGAVRAVGFLGFSTSWNFELPSYMQRSLPLIVPTLPPTLPKFSAEVSTSLFQPAAKYPAAAYEEHDDCCGHESHDAAIQDRQNELVDENWLALHMRLVRRPSAASASSASTPQAQKFSMLLAPKFGQEGSLFPRFVDSVYGGARNSEPGS